jgi:SAM-dependent methyltransferase
MENTERKETTICNETRYPIFHDPEGYLKLRQPPGLAGIMKACSERRALGSCLQRIVGIDSLLDVPCGPGRLFPYYRERGYRVVGLDMSPEMILAASQLRRDLGLRGFDFRADAFHLPYPEDAFDCVVSVRFAYYFERSKRVELLRELTRVSRLGIIVQLKINYSLLSRSRRWRGKASRRGRGKILLSKREIFEDFLEANLKVERIAPLSIFGSDRAFVLARPG